MSEKKPWAKTVMGWFVVEDGAGSQASGPADPGTDKAAEIIAKYASGGAATRAAPPPVVLSGPLPPVVNGSVDFAAVYEAAGIDLAEQDRIKKAQDLLRSLPAETPVAVKRQIVEASLKAFGVPTEKIIESAVAEMEALVAFVHAGQTETEKLLTEAAEQISSLEKEIASVRQIMANGVSEQETRTRAVNIQKLTIQDVLEFFGEEAVAKVVQQSPKLHSPTDA